MKKKEKKKKNVHKPSGVLLSKDVNLYMLELPEYM